MTEHAVVIAGAGPAGMMLAAELALAKVDVAVIERRPDHVLVGSRAGGFHSRTIEVLDQRGVADRFLAEGQVAQAAMFALTVLDMSDFPTRHPRATVLNYRVGPIPGCSGWGLYAWPGRVQTRTRGKRTWKWAKCVEMAVWPESGWYADA
jgi:choline dehydrogenase-like flavoprotein